MINHEVAMLSFALQSSAAGLTTLLCVLRFQKGKSFHVLQLEAVWSDVGFFRFGEGGGERIVCTDVCCRAPEVHIDPVLSCR